jgi:hypothetical protein
MLQVIFGFRPRRRAGLSPQHPGIGANSKSRPASRDHTTYQIISLANASSLSGTHGETERPASGLCTWATRQQFDYRVSDGAECPQRVSAHQLCDPNHCFEHTQKDSCKQQGDCQVLHLWPEQHLALKCLIRVIQPRTRHSSAPRMPRRHSQANSDHVHAWAPHVAQVVDL